MAISIPHQGGASLKASPLWLPKCLQWVKEKDKFTCIETREGHIKAEWKRATAKKTVFNKFVALFRPLVEMVEKVRIKGYGCPKVRIIHSKGVEMPRNKEQIAKCQGPRLAKVIEYLAQEVICHAGVSSSHLFSFKKVAKLNPKIR